MSEEKRKLCIEEVIGGGGNWALVYQHGNWGLNHVLMMIPTTELDPDCQESLVNNSCTSVLWGLQEEAQAVYQWLAKHSNTPFIVAGEYLVDCAQKMATIGTSFVRTASCMNSGGPLFIMSIMTIAESKTYCIEMDGSPLSTKQTNGLRKNIIKEEMKS